MTVLIRREWERANREVSLQLSRASALGALLSGPEIEEWLLSRTLTEGKEVEVSGECEGIPLGTSGEDSLIQTSLKAVAAKNPGLMPTVD